MDNNFGLFRENLRGKSAVVIGMGVSNTPLVKLLLSCGARVTVHDRNENIDRAPWEALGVSFSLGESYLDDVSGDIVFRTPGLRPDVPGLERARAAGSLVTSEMEVFLRVCPCPVIGVTGSDGKTTTTTLIAEMLKAEGIHTHVGGNIGAPLLADAASMAETDMCVVELSSFQLMGMEASPQTAVITNIAPNHLDWHRGMDEYVAAKRAIFENQDSNGLLILNGDNGYTSRMKGLGRTEFFGWDRVRDGVIDGFLPTGDILIKGRHNVENYIAAISAVRGLVSDESILGVARSFGGVAHRNQLVAEVGGVKYYNDSIGSSPSRTVATLSSHEDGVILIAGGYDKKIPFDALAGALPGKVKAVLLIGATAGAIREAAERVMGCPPLHDAGDLARAVDMARELARPGDSVLLSPACASFDQFKNFEERGNAFVNIIKGMREC